MDFVTVCPWCVGLVADDPLFPIADDYKPDEPRCCGDGCRHYFADGGCPREQEV